MLDITSGRCWYQTWWIPKYCTLHEEGVAIRLNSFRLIAGRVTHSCVSKLTIIGSDNGLSPGRRQAIIWTNSGMLLIWPLGTNFSEMLIEVHICEMLIKVHTFSFKKMHLKISSAKWRQFYLGLNVWSDPLSYFQDRSRIPSLVNWLWRLSGRQHV